MRDVKVKIGFVDKTNRLRKFNVGEVLTFEDERAEEVVNRGLAEYVTDTTKKEVSPALFGTEKTEPRRKSGKLK